MKISFQIIISSIVGIFIFTPHVACQDTLSLCWTYQGGNRYDLLVNDFTGVRSLQFTVSWDTSHASYMEVANLNEELEFIDSDIGAPPPQFGKFSVIAFSARWAGANLPQGSRLFSLYLETENSALSLPRVDSSLIPVEFTTNEGVIPVKIQENCGLFSDRVVTGQVFLNPPSSCTSIDQNYSLDHAMIQFTSEIGVRFYANVREDGEYWIYLEEGLYDIDLFIDENVFRFCSGPSSVDIMDGAGPRDSINFLLEAVKECSKLEVNINTPKIRSCRPTKTMIHYRNIGSTSAKDAYIICDLGKSLDSITWSSHPYHEIDSGTISFDLGTVNPGDHGQIKIWSETHCNLVTRATYCMSAEIFPITDCDEIDPRWSGASIAVSGECTGDEIIFHITNHGLEDMQTPTSYQIIADHQSIDSGIVILNSGQSEMIMIPADNRSYRIIAEQVAFHPGQSRPTAHVELCGPGPEYSKGYILDYPEDDLDHHLDILCIESVNSFDPNDKLVQPQGIGADHAIAPGTTLDYTIRFQNTGTDTAFCVRLIDTLGHNLDPRTISQIESSHSSEFEVLPDGIIRVTYENIYLPDSTANEPESHGFFSFQIDHYPDLPLPSTILNQAAIYFDLNEPIFTNIAMHTVDTVVQDVTSTSTDYEENTQLNIYPNPLRTGQTLYLSRDISGQASIININGKLMMNALVDQGQIRLTEWTFPTGIYYCKIFTADKVYLTKLLFL